MKNRLKVELEFANRGINERLKNYNSVNCDDCNFIFQIDEEAKDMKILAVNDEADKFMDVTNCFELVSNNGSKTIKLEDACNIDNDYCFSGLVQPDYYFTMLLSPYDRNQFEMRKQLSSKMGNNRFDHMKMVNVEYGVFKDENEEYQIIEGKRYEYMYDKRVKSTIKYSFLSCERRSTKIDLDKVLVYQSKRKPITRRSY